MSERFIQCLEPRQLFAAAPVPTSAVIYDSKGYEAPTFKVGKVTGQAGWSQAPLTGVSVTANVEKGVASSGKQALQVNRNAGDLRVFPTKTTSVKATYLHRVEIDWDMRVQQTNNQKAPYGPFFGVEVYGKATAASAFPIAGAAGVDASTGDVLYEAPGTGYLTETKTKVSFSKWYHFEIIADFDAHTYALYLNGKKLVDTAKLTGVKYGFVDANIKGFSEADIAATEAQDEPPIETGSAFFDNYKITGLALPPVKK